MKLTEHRRPTALLLILGLALMPLALGGCSDADKVDTGGVSLVVGDFDLLPFQVSVNDAVAGGAVTIGEIELESILLNPSAGVSELQTIELRSYEVVYTRADTGSRVPPPMVQQIFGIVPPGGNNLLVNIPILLGEQLLNPPLSDLLFVNGGFDRETGSESIKLNIRLRFFGRTLGGRDVVTNPQRFTVEFLP